MILPNKNLREIERFGPDEGKLHVFQEADEKKKLGKGLSKWCCGPSTTSRNSAIHGQKLRGTSAV